MSALLPWQTALLAHLNGDPGLQGYKHASMQAAGVRTYDHVPSGTAYPYNVLESHTEVSAGILGSRDSKTNTTQIGVWDSYAGYARILAVMGLIEASLARVIEVEGYKPFRARIEFANTVQQPGALRRGVIRVRRPNLT